MTAGGTASPGAPGDPVGKTLGRLFTVLVGALCVVGAAFVLHYRSDSPAVGPYSWRYALGVIAPFLGLCSLTAAALALPEAPWSRLARRLSAAPGRLPDAAALAAVALGEWWAFRVADEYASILLLLLVPVTVAAVWVRLRGSAEVALALAPVALFALVLFAVDLPGFLVAPPLVVWGDGSTFRFQFPTRPPFIGPGGRLRPDLDALMRAPEYPRGARLLTDSHGFRTSHEVTQAPAPGRARILSLGDSFAVGFCADQDEFYGPLLERDLGGAVEVVSAEVSDPAYGLCYLQSFGASFAPRLVLYGLSGNDLLQTGWFVGPDRRFVLRGGTLAANPSYRGEERDLFAEYRDYAYPRPGTAAPPDSAPVGSRLLAKLARFRLFSGLMAASLRSGSRPVVMPGYTAAWERVDHRLRLLDGAADLGFFYTRDTRPVDALYATFLAVLDALAATSRAAGAELVLVLFPQRYQAQPGDWEVMRKFWNLDPADFDLDLADRRILAACRERGIRCVDLAAAFRDAAAAGPLYLPGGDVHFNRSGHEVAARAVAAYLRAEGLVGGSPAGGASRGAPTGFNPVSR